MLAHLAPVLVIGTRSNRLSLTEPYIENHGEGAAFDVSPVYRADQQNIQIAQNIIGPQRSAILNADWKIAEKMGIEVKYKSQDGRYFLTVLEAEDARGPALRQSIIEIDSVGNRVTSST